MSPTKTTNLKNLMRNKAPQLLSLLLLTTASPQAANIAFVSFHAPTDASNTTAADYGFTIAPDVGYTDVLRDAGHTVTRYLTQNNLQSNAAMIAALNASDLVIISRSVNSAHYETADEAAAWNGITAPTMILGGYVLRNVRLGLTSGGTMVDVGATNVRLDVLDPSHPVFAGIPLDGDGVMTDDCATRITYSGTTDIQQLGISVNTSPVVGGTILATVANAGDPAVGGMIIGEWQDGATINGGRTLDGHRMVFLTGSRETGGVPTAGAGIYDLSPAGEEMFLNAVNYMAVPEPSTFTLFALGAGAFLLRRRK